ncbi:MAG: DUF4340 domain-containing protein [Candidatus Goldbacteria bacterium]|nr:DUF4340 domain-containing protein [Candidatus Goldiibacteriota bacterium]
MKPNKTVTALIIFALLGAYYYFVEIKKKSADKEKKAEQEKLFPGFDEGAVNKITVNNGKEIITVIKQGDTWMLETPLKAPADDGMINGMLKDFAQAKVQRKIEDGDPEEYGLGKKENTGFKFYADSEYFVDFGDENPTESYAYVVKNGDDNFYIIDSILKRYSEKKLFDFRNKGLFKIEEPGVSAVEIDLKDRKYTLEKDDKGNWNLIKPFKAAVKKDRAGAIIAYMKNSAVKYFEADKDAAKFGLALPSQKVVLTTSDGKKTVYFGVLDGVKKSVFAKAQGVPGIFELPDYIYTNIPKADEILNKQILVIEDDGVDRVEIKYKNKFIEGARGKDKKWKTVKAQGLSKEEKKITDTGAVISAIRQMEYAEKFDAGAKAEFFTRSQPSLEIIMKKTGAEDINVIFGDKADGELYYIKTADGVFSFDKNKMNSINLPGFDSF